MSNNCSAPNLIEFSIIENDRDQSDSSLLTEQIEKSIAAAKGFCETVLTKEIDKGALRLRVSASTFAGSYFLVDDICFFSLYARKITGSRAPCLLFSKNAARLAGYFEVLEEDFLATWDQSDVILGGNN